MAKKQDVQIIDFTDRFDKLLDKKPKGGSLKNWNKEWDKLTKEFLGNEEPTPKEGGKERKGKARKGKDVGDVPENMEKQTTLQ